MTVKSGFGGQSYQPEAAARIPALRLLLGAARPIHVDGGIKAGTAADAVKQGADVLVAGTALFSAARDGGGGCVAPPEGVAESGLGALGCRSAAGGADEHALGRPAGEHHRWLQVGAEASVCTDAVHPDRLGVKPRDRILAAEDAEAGHMLSLLSVGRPLGTRRQSCRIVAGTPRGWPRRLREVGMLSGDAYATEGRPSGSCAPEAVLTQA